MNCPSVAGSETSKSSANFGDDANKFESLFLLSC